MLLDIFNCTTPSNIDLSTRSTIFKSLSCWNYTEVFCHGWPMLECLGHVPTQFHPMTQDLGHFHGSKTVWNLLRLSKCWQICDGLMNCLFLPCLLSYYQSYRIRLLERLFKMFILTVVLHNTHVTLEYDCKYNCIKWSFL